MQRRYDLYGNVHKGLRRELAILVAELGAVDPNDDAAVAEFVTRFRGVEQILSAHSLHEDSHLGPHLRRLAPASFAEMEAEHLGLEAELAELAHLAGELVGHAFRRQALHRFYLRLARFVARYWLHLHREETEYVAAFHAAYTDAEIAAIEGALVASIEPQKLARFMEMMSLAMNVEDQRDLARHAPPAPAHA